MNYLRLLREIDLAISKMMFQGKLKVNHKDVPAKPISRTDRAVKVSSKKGRARSRLFSGERRRGFEKEGK